ncbi:MAG: hypothetical protein WCG10_03220 [Chlamydiota bacterium]
MSFVHGAIGSWTTIPTPITTTSAVYSSSNVFSCNIKGANQIAFAWSDSPNNNPQLILYDALHSTFSSIISVSNTAVEKTLTAVYLTLNPDLHQIFLTVGDEHPNSNNLHYSTYSYLKPSSTMQPFQLVGSATDLGANGCFACYNSAKQAMVFNWIAKQSTNPTFTTLPNNGSITSDTIIQNTQGDWNALSCYNSHDQQIVFSWRNLADGTPYYAIYNSNNQQISPPTQISNIPSVSSNNVFCAYNSAENQTVFSWVSASPSYPYYAIYDHDTQKFVTPATLLNSNTAQNTVCCCYNNLLNQYIFSWASSTNTPYYAIYDCFSQSLSSVNAIPSSGNATTVNCCYNPGLNQAIFNWISTSNSNYPYYAIYTMNTPDSIYHNNLLKAINYNREIFLKRAR